MDATVILTEPLDWILGKNLTGPNFFQAMYNPRNMTISCKVPVIETSFLVAPPAHPLIHNWLSRMMELDECKEINISRKVYRIPKQANLHRNYHFVYHVLTQMLIDTPQEHLGNYNLFDCNNLKYMNMYFQNVDQLTKSKYQASFGPLLKLIGSERKRLERLISSRKVEQGSFIDKMLLKMPHSTVLYNNTD